jgi:hypothetical protein
MSPAMAARMNGVSGSPSTSGRISRTQMYISLDPWIDLVDVV